MMEASLPGRLAGVHQDYLMGDKMRSENRIYRFNETFINYPIGSSSSTDSAHTVVTDMQRTGANNPGWHKRVSQDLNATSPMVVNVREAIKTSPLQANASWATGQEISSVSVTGYASGVNLPEYLASHDSSGDLEASVYAAAMRKFINKVRDADHQFQGGVFIGEIVPTFRMLLNPFGSLRRGMSHYFATLKGRRRGASPQSLKRILAETWLETAFGWQPLLHDVLDALKAVERLYKPSYRKTVRAQQVGTADLGESVKSDVNLAASFIFKCRQKRHVFYRQTFYGSLRHLQKRLEGIHNFETVKSMSGFDLHSWAPTAWEILPWSFLIDYFVNVGTIIDAFSTDHSLLSWHSGVSRKETTVTRLSDLDVQASKNLFGPAIRSMGGTGGMSMSKMITVQRTPSIDSFYPGLVFSLGLSSKQLLNIAALVAVGHRLEPYYRTR